MATTKKRSAYDIEKEIRSIQEEHHKKSASLTMKETIKVTDKLKALRLELSDIYSDGAQVCPDCKNKPLGMKKGAGVYEVGCVVCAPYEDKTDQGDPAMISYSARGESPEEAVEKWNNGDWVFRLIPKELKLSDVVGKMIKG